jgi:membrane protein YfhO
MKQLTARLHRIPGEIWLLVGLNAAFYGRFLVTGRVLMLRDMFFDHYPWFLFMRQTLAQGTLPLWNPYTGFGEALHADLDPAMLYPATWLILLIGPGVGVLVSYTLHLTMAAVACYATARLMGVGRIGALLTGMVFSFNTFTIVTLEWIPDVHVMSWAPVVLAVLAYWIKSGRWWVLFLLPGIFALQFLAGYPEGVLYTVAAAGLFTLFSGAYRWRQSGRVGTLVTPVLVLGIAGLCGIVLCMAQILPTYEALELSYRSEIDSGADDGSVNPLMWLTLLVPSLYGTQGFGGHYWAPSVMAYWLGSFHVGVVAMVLFAMVGIRRVTGLRATTDTEPDPLTRMCAPYWLTVLILSGLYAMGQHTPFFPFLWESIGLLQGFRWPSKSLVCVTLALSFLAGIAFDFLLRNTFEEPDRAGFLRITLYRWGALGLFALISIFVLFTLANEGALGKSILSRFFNLSSIKTEYMHRIPWDTLLRDAIRLAVIGPLVALALTLYFRREATRHILGPALILIAIGDLLLVSAPLVITAPKSILEVSSPHADRLRSHDNVYRFYEVRDETQRILYAEPNTEPFRLGLESVVGSWALPCRVYAAENTSTFSLGEMSELLGLLRHPDLPEPARQRLFALLNCKYLVKYPSLSEYFKTGNLGDTQIVELPSAMPRAYVVGGPQIYKKRSAMYQTLGLVGFNPTAVALAAQADTGGEDFSDLQPGQVAHTITRLADTPQRLQIDLHTARAGLLVVTDSHYPGWEATVNGRPRSILKVNGGFRALRVDEGTNVVIMRYRPAPFYRGAMISVVGLVVYLAALAWAYQKSRVAAA